MILCAVSQQTYVNVAEKNIQTFVNFVQTFRRDHAIIMTVKTPQYII